MLINPNLNFQRCVAKLFASRHAESTTELRIKKLLCNANRVF